MDGVKKEMPDPDPETIELIRGWLATAHNIIERKGPHGQISDDACERALNVLSYALKVPQVWAEAKALLLTMIPRMEMAGYRGDWVPYLEQGAAMSTTAGDADGQGELSLAIGYLALLRANYAQAEMWFERGWRHFQSVGSASGEGRALNRLAMTQMRQQDYESSRELASAALETLDADDIDRANSYYVLGTVCHEAEEWLDAEHYYRHSLEIWEEAGDIRRTAWGLRNLGPALALQGKYQEAYECYTRALAIFEHVHDPANKAMTQVNLANLSFWTEKRFDEAIQLLTASQKIFKRLDDRLNLAKTALNLGLSLDETGKHEDARIIYETSIELWEELGNVASLCNALDCLGECYMTTCEYAEAIEQFNYALVRLEEITDHPQYNSLNKMLNEHLAQAQGRL